MTNDDFAQFVARHFVTASTGRPNYSAAGKALSLGREQVQSFCEGRTRKGAPMEVPRWLALAAWAYEVSGGDDARREKISKIVEAASV